MNLNTLKIFFRFRSAKSAFLTTSQNNKKRNLQSYCQNDAKMTQKTCGIKYFFKNFKKILFFTKKMIRDEKAKFFFFLFFLSFLGVSRKPAYE